MKKVLFVFAVLLIAVITINAQNDSKEKKSIPATKIVPAPGQTNTPAKDNGPVLNAGMKLPDFNVPSLDNPKVTYSKKQMLGKVYMVDFWASWCGPCVGEMKVIHDAYEKFKSKGFEIISFSCDVKPEDVAKFRKDKWAMPWMHVFFGRGNNCLYPKMKEEFGLKFIPSPFLVDKNGNILAMGDDLRGEKLIETVGKYFK